MRKGREWFYVTLSLVSFVTTSNAATWEKLREEALTQYQSKNYPKAIASAEKAVASAKTQYGLESREYAQSLDDLSALYRVQGKALKNQAQALKKKLGITGNIVGLSTEVFFDEVEEAHSTSPGATQAPPQGEDIASDAQLPHR